jgi:hypothetical protein
VSGPAIDVGDPGDGGDDGGSPTMRDVANAAGVTHGTFRSVIRA